MIVHPRRLMGCCLATVLAALLCYSLMPATLRATAATPTLAQNPLMQDRVYAYAHALSTHFRKDPACDRQAAMLLNFASPLAGSEEYRQRVVNEMLGKIPDHCIGR